MKLLKITSISILLILISTVSYAEDPPKIVTDGFKAYIESGFEAAFNTLLKGSPLENDKTSMMNLKGGFTQIEAMYGKMISYEILKVIKITSSTNRTYTELQYEKGPLFLYIDCYKSKNGWVVPMMKFHTEADKLLPDNIMNQ